MTIPKLIATSLGLGNLPVAPGTFGALGGLVLSLTLMSSGVSHPTFTTIHIALIILSYAGGVWSCQKLSAAWGDDPSRVVIDETMGFWISILFLPLHLYILIAGFVLFRFFDIVKPLGIKKIDGIKSPHAVMLDDALAGIYTNVTLHVLLYFIHKSPLI
ncbi:MAG: phosphatidylglycerophosphatase A [Saprospiraceae bacterium]